MLRLGPAILTGSDAKDSTIPPLMVATGVVVGEKTSAGVR